MKLIDEPPYVLNFSRILSDVEATPELLVRLNDVNAQPFVAPHVVQAFTNFCAIADAMGVLLQDEFGGETAFAQSMPSSLKH